MPGKGIVLKTQDGLRARDGHPLLVPPLAHPPLSIEVSGEKESLPKHLSASGSTKTIR